MAIGALNGVIVVRTGLPSFIVTLAFLFILRGFTIYLPQLIERKTIIGGIDKAAEGDCLAARRWWRSKARSAEPSEDRKASVKASGRGSGS